MLSYERRDWKLQSRKLFHPAEKEGDDWEGQEEGWGRVGGRFERMNTGDRLKGAFEQLERSVLMVHEDDHSI